MQKNVIQWDPVPLGFFSKAAAQDALHCDASVEVIVMEFGIVKRLILGNLGNFQAGKVPPLTHQWYHESPLKIIHHTCPDGSDSVLDFSNVDEISGVCHMTSQTSTKNVSQMCHRS